MKNSAHIRWSVWPPGSRGAQTLPNNESENLGISFFRPRQLDAHEAHRATIPIHATLLYISSSPFPNQDPAYVVSAGSSSRLLVQRYALSLCLVGTLKCKLRRIMDTAARRIRERRPARWWTTTITTQPAHPTDPLALTRASSARAALLTVDEVSHCA
ncbi:hypothetical protein FA95DRAFT_709755 [Auriscalpium vulgare]|uniref:Uncharacterized protein n=1 Tax=Auriscalpium vulgare TaxID=40419 RepID=A0ACB8RB77_9AGAM|nr:hypothetical protein FA95DRAFT_709755 [Auriscalpium vulgare]